MTALLDGSASNGRKFGITSVGSSPKVLLLSGSSSSDGSVEAEYSPSRRRVVSIGLAS